jgi:hypothetical protein
LRFSRRADRFYDFAMHPSAFTSIVAAGLLLSGAIASSAAAQTWSSMRGRPALWQITSVDATGDQTWPYGDEDIAGDGAGTFEDDEAGADLRTVYADADADRLWLRAYVAAESAPSENAVAYFFLDTDARNATGGDAASPDLWPELEADPSPGGYERVIAVGADETLVGAWRWDTETSGWLAIDERPNEIRVEVDSDIDPIRIFAPERGYFQVDVDHEISTLDSSCDGNIFVRIWHDDPPMRAFGDDDDEPSACRLPLDPLGDPIVLREPMCTQDSDCPAAGECDDGVCIFTYECTRDVDCPAGESCSDGACTDGDAGEGGAGGAGGGGAGAGGAAGDMVPPGNVQGGAFHCAATRSSSAPVALTMLLVLALLHGRRRV